MVVQFPRIVRTRWHRMPGEFDHLPTPDEVCFNDQITASGERILLERAGFAGHMGLPEHLLGLPPRILRSRLDVERERPSARDAIRDIGAHKLAKP